MCYIPCTALYVFCVVGRMRVGRGAPWPQQPCSPPLALLQAKPSRLHCSHCDETYTLPQNGTIKLYKELRCPLDDFELVLWSSGSRGKSYPLCPYCYNHPPFRDMKKGENTLLLGFCSPSQAGLPHPPGYLWFLSAPAPA